MVKKIENFLLAAPMGVFVLAAAFLVTLGWFLPWAAVDFYSQTFKPCGDTMAALWCTLPLAGFALCLSVMFLAVGLVRFVKLLRARKAKNIALGFITTVIFLIASGGDFDYTEPLFNYRYIVITPLVVLVHYYAFNLVKKPVLGMRPGIASLALWFVLFLLFLAVKSRATWVF